jgi:hypothetical protein
LCVIAVLPFFVGVYESYSTKIWSFRYGNYDLSQQNVIFMGECDILTALEAVYNRARW